jgi:large subunit ribosomal protein L28
MAKSQITGKRQMRGHNVSHSNIKTGRWQKVNVQRRRLWVSELNRFVTVQVATSDLRTITKIGLLAFAKQHGYKVA